MSELLDIAEGVAWAAVVMVVSMLSGMGGYIFAAFSSSGPVESLWVACLISSWAALSMASMGSRD